jgi:hypothetical protein
MSTLTGDLALKRVTLGFVGGLTLTRRMTLEHLDGLKAALASDASWHEVRTAQQHIVISVSRLAFYELEETARRVGFG